MMIVSQKIFERRNTTLDLLSKNLMSGEQAVYSTRKHWIIFWAPALTILLYYVSAFTGVLVFKPLVEILASLIASSLYTLIFLILLYHHLKAAEFVITNKRILMKTGLIKRKSLDTSLTKIKNIKVLQGPIGRIFNYGSIFVRDSSGTNATFMFVNHPIEFREKVQEQIDLIQGNAKEHCIYN